MKKLKLIALALLLIGLADSSYLTLEHFGSVPLVCPVNRIINCFTVLTSRYSVVFGVPLAVAGLIWAAVMLILLAYSASQVSKTITPIWGFIGAAGVAYSLIAQYLLGNICVYCATLDATIILFLIAVYFGVMRK
ncbi:MAG: vitamin K epoxide reductase family protein [Candidatus Marsarchaeota archaeon]|jgi:uncharacterized membrane protein|nr:vitamin K epoxide reductase family protein [Candidatus Marsarchaeota archaeon]